MSDERDGRPPVLAVDIGGTKMAGALVDAEGSVRRRRQVPTGADPVGALTAVVDAVVAGEQVSLAGVGVGCGGPMLWPAGVVSPLNIPDWRDGFPLRAWFRERFPGLPVRVHNDALCFVAVENWRGAAAGKRDVLGMVVSTGVGGGLVLDGRLRDGASGNAGHVGHIVAEPEGPLCGCGARGCLEAVARGPMVVAWAAERGCRAADGRELAAFARNGDPIAVAAFTRAGAAIGRVVAGVAALLELDAVVIGGGLAGSGDLLFAPLRRAYAEQALLSFAREVPVLPSALGADAGIVGAAALVLAGDRYWSGD